MAVWRASGRRRGARGSPRRWRRTSSEVAHAAAPRSVAGLEPSACQLPRLRSRGKLAWGRRWPTATPADTR
eukprot:scaffold2088_cov399-Prasinococcus_capsulatus_cf.AAC.22